MLGALSEHLRSRRRLDCAVCLALILVGCAPAPGQPKDAARNAVAAQAETSAARSEGAGSALRDLDLRPHSLNVSTPAAPVGSLDWAVAGGWRAAPERERDRWRHPLETLRFFEVQPRDVVVEIQPGAGWYTAILAPYLKHGGGYLIAAGIDPATKSTPQQILLKAYQDRFGNRKDLFGTIDFRAFGRGREDFCSPGEADKILSFRNVHNWMAAGWADQAFVEFFRCLRPGGILGIVEHRADAQSEQDPRALSGYVQEAFVKQLALNAGFEFVASSQINANPNDTKDHPFGVWTLPPVLLTAPTGAAPDPTFDSEPYRLIGESDRMTLKFRRPTIDQPSAAAPTGAKEQVAPPANASPAKRP